MKLSKKFVTAVEKAFDKAFLHTEPDILTQYGTDWTNVYPPRPSAVVFPRTTDEVATFLRLCSEDDVPIVPSGGRTGLAGGAVAANEEVVVSLEKMNRIHPVDVTARCLRVQAGAVTEAVHNHCAKEGLTWPIDLAAKGSSLIGGNLSTNAGGVRVIRYGHTRHWVLGIQAVTMDGTILDLHGALEKNNVGLDLMQLFIGSEGTLGVITEATLKLTPIPRKTDVFFFAVADLDAALQLLTEARSTGPFVLHAFEYLTHACLEAVTKAGDLRSPFAEPTAGYVLLEAEGTEGSSESMLAWLERLLESGLVSDGTMAQSDRERRELWSFREQITESLAQKGLVHKNDVSVPLASLKPFLSDLNELCRTEFSAFELFVFGHLGDGNLHVNLLKPNDLDASTFRARCNDANDRLFALVKKYRGSISAEHGIGLLKKKWLAYSRSEAEIDLARSIKNVLDPKHLLNPGKIFD